MAGIKDIAELADVSPRTVSRALRGNGYVSREKRQRIQRIAENLNYTPNRTAQSLRYRRANEIALIVWSVASLQYNSEIYLEKIAALEKSLRPLGHVVKIRFAQCDGKSREAPWAVIEELKRERPLGVVMFPMEAGVSLNRLFALELERADIPVVLLDSEPDPELSVVHIDRPAGVYDAVTHLGRNGCKRIAYLGPPHTPHRLDGFNQAVQDLQLHPDYIFIPAGRPQDYFRAAHDKVAEIVTRRIDAVQAYSDECALGVLTGLREQKMDVPGQVAVVGFDNRKAGLLAIPTLTTLAHPNREAGEAAAKMIARRIDNRENEPVGRTVTLPLKLVKRGSA